MTFKRSLLRSLLLAMVTTRVAAEPPAFPTNVVLSTHAVHKNVPISIGVSWSPSLAPGVIGYNLYYGTNANNYTYEVYVGDVTNAVITNFYAHTRYYCAEAAVNGYGVQGPLSPATSVSGFALGQYATLQQSNDGLTWENDYCQTNAGVPGSYFFRTAVSAVTAALQQSSDLSHWSVIYSQPVTAGWYYRSAIITYTYPLP